MKFALGLIAAAFALSLALYSTLPDRMPVHFDLHGQANGFQSKAVGAFAMPVTMIVLAFVFAMLPRLSPRGYEIDRNSRAFRAITLSVLALSLAVHAVMLFSAAGFHVPPARLFPILLGALFAFLGNYLGKVRRNFFIGIRTPWTLADEDVWFRTHRFSGKLFVIAGLIGMLGAALPDDRGMPFILGVVIVAALISIVYSYAIYRQLHGAQS